MKLPVLVTLMFFVLYLPSVFAEESHDSHDHHDGGALALEAPEAGRWETDTYLRRGMGGIRDAVSSGLGTFHEGGFSEQEVSALATAIDRNVSLMIENCDLEPKADATLHVLLGEILDGKARLQGNPRDREGMEKILGALHKYPEYFDHDGWQSPDTSH